MPEFGTPEFDQFWRVHGFFGGVEHTVNIGPADHRITIGVAANVAAENALVIQDDLAEMRDELTRIRAALDRIGGDIHPGLSGGTVDQLRLEPNLISLGGWVASALQTLGAMTYYLSEPSLMKVRGFLKPRMSDFESHPSRKLNSGEPRRPRIRRPPLR